MNSTIIIVLAVGLIGIGLIRRAVAARGAGSGEVRARIDAGALVVDVRTEEEFAAGHVPGARNIPLHEIEARRGELGEPHQPLVLYCRSGNRSGQAMTILARHGFTDMINGGGLHQMLAVHNGGSQ